MTAHRRHGRAASFFEADAELQGGRAARFSFLAALLYGVGITLYLLPLSSWVGIVAAVALGALGVVVAGGAYRRRMRLVAVLFLAALAGLVALFVGQWVLDSRLVPGLFGPKAALILFEVLTFGPLAFCVVFALRSGAHRARIASLLELLFVAGSVAMMLADHRNRMINRPRAFSDWVWTLGFDPAVILVGVGVAATLGAVFLFLRGQTLAKLASTACLLVFVGGLLFLVRKSHVDVSRAPDTLGLTDKGEGGKKGKGGKPEQGSKGGAGAPDLFKDDYESQGPPTPVAIAVFRDDLSTVLPLLYFRQRALSKYNGHHLVADDKNTDSDVVATFPRDQPIVAVGDQSAADHVKVPTTMYLIVDHPQPVALSHAQTLRPTRNPNTQRFVAAYDVESSLLAVSPTRLLGRRSVPRGWSAEKRAHYLATPDDPRYATLAEIIERDVDPRFAGDDLARAYVVKRYLEKEGFYSLKSKHSNATDPAASFLFGTMTGYCIHFAHAAVYLFRSLGIAARVAVGYAVETSKRSGGSSLLIMSDRAHAWPEIHLEGIGWVTFDVYPERSDAPAASPVDFDLEKLLGELAREDPTAGKNAEGTPWEIPWLLLAIGLASLVGLALLTAYAGKVARRLAPAFAGARYPQKAYVALLDRLSDLGLARRRGETRERHALRLALLSPHLADLTRAHLGGAFGSAQPPSKAEFDLILAKVELELRLNVPPVKRTLALLNPIGWILTR